MTNKTEDIYGDFRLAVSGVSDAIEALEGISDMIGGLHHSAAIDSARIRNTLYFSLGALERNFDQLVAIAEPIVGRAGESEGANSA